jgi:hypothetical protein
MRWAAVLGLVAVLSGCSAQGDAKPTTTSERIAPTSDVSAPPTSTTVASGPPSTVWDCPPEQPDDPQYSQSDCMQALGEAGGYDDYSEYPDPYEGDEPVPDAGAYEPGIDDYDLPEQQYP